MVYQIDCYCYGVKAFLSRPTWYQFFFFANFSLKLNSLVQFPDLFTKDINQ